MGYCHRGRVVLRVEIIRQTLRRLVDGENVHPVCARAQNSAQTARAEFERTVKSIRYLILFSFYGGELVVQLGAAFCFSQPEVVEVFDFLFHGSAPSENRYYRPT